MFGVNFPKIKRKQESLENFRGTERRVFIRMELCKSWLFLLAWTFFIGALIKITEKIKKFPKNIII